MKNRLSIVAAAFLVLLLGCQPSEKGRVIEEVPTGYVGDARLNPYLAAERYLNKVGFDARASRTWDGFGPEVGVVVIPASYLTSRGLGMRIAEWIAEGGIVIMTINGGEPEINDFTYNSFWELPEEGDYPGMDYLLAETHVTLSSEDWGSVPEKELAENGHLERPWHIAQLTPYEDGQYEIEQEGSVAIESSQGSDWEGLPNLGSRAVLAGHGSGQLLVMAHARPFRNPYLDRKDHARFLETIARWGSRGETVFIYGSSNSFFTLLWQRGWMIVIAGLFLLIAWFWLRIPRFGPIMNDSFQEDRSYGQELTASARFLWRGGYLPGLIIPLRARLSADHDGDTEAHINRLSERSGLSRDEVVEALNVLPAKDPGTVLRIVKNLQTLLKS